MQNSAWYEHNDARKDCSRFSKQDLLCFIVRKIDNFYQNCFKIKRSNNASDNDKARNYSAFKNRLHNQNLYERKKFIDKLQLHFRIELTNFDRCFERNKRFLHSHCRLQYDNDWDEERSINFNENFATSQIEFIHKIWKKDCFQINFEFHDVVLIIQNAIKVTNF